MCEAAQPGHGGDNGRRDCDLVLGQMSGLGPGVGDELFALAIVELLRDRKGPVGRPAPALAAGLLQRRHRTGAAGPAADAPPTRSVGRYARRRPWRWLRPRPGPGCAP